MTKTSIPLGTYAHHERHWHYVRSRRLRKTNHTAKEILIGQIVSVVGAVIAGLVLDFNKAELATMAGVFLILPGVFDLGGAVAGAMGARINHRLGEGAPTRHVLRDSLLHAFTLICFSAVFLSIFGAILGRLLFDADLWRLFMVAFLSAIAAAVVGLPVIAIATVLAKKRGLDADNFIGPIETSVFDTLTVLTVTLMVVTLR